MGKAAVMNAPTAALSPRVFMSCVKTVLMQTCGEGQAEGERRAEHASQTLASLTAAASDGTPDVLISNENFLDTQRGAPPPVDCCSKFDGRRLRQTWKAKNENARRAG